MENSLCTVSRKGEKDKKLQAVTDCFIGDSPTHQHATMQSGMQVTAQLRASSWRSGFAVALPCRQLHLVRMDAVFLFPQASLNFLSSM
ncbi:hypothetical protein CBR_g12596 [Chara braunii]|uniref:Uncharacterized protein n=1 Tax=Chara braunii TaxID=69332 RepID=A0A388KS59_CHABU|nr:hypothetical protein CBR_g12596 [Chara braunii]|eukprot:GBG72876.1 hypothetical protein CBR_g12596 [Chara braunii]